MNCIQLLDRARLYPNKKFAVLADNKTITYQDFVSTTNQLSVYFDKLGLQSSDKIILSTADHQSLVELTIAAYSFGLTVVLLDYNTKSSRAHSIIKNCEPKAIFLDTSVKLAWEVTHENCIEIQRTQVGKKKFLSKIFAQKTTDSTTEINNNSYPACLQKFEKVPLQNHKAIDPESIAYIMYTSGSTSDPKGVAISYDSLFSHLETLQKVYEMNESSAILNVLNLYHADGINQGPLLAFYCGATWYCPFKLDTSKLDLIYYAIYKYKISHLFVVPTLLSFFEKYHEDFEDSFQTPDFKYIISVAAQLEEKLWTSVSSLFKVQILNVYGLTETVNGSLFCGPSSDSFKIGTVGKPVDCEVKIIDENGTEVGPNKTGELALFGKHIMKEYFGNPTATHEVLIDGWLHTGDYAQQDEQGFVKIIGRKKSMINSGGFRIQPEEIEEIILNTNEVHACKVIGIYDAVLTEKIIACIQLNEGSTLNEIQLYKYLRQNLEQEKVPHDIYFVADLPRGISGKIQVDQLKKNIEQQLRKPIENSAETLETIIQTAATTFKIDSNDINEASSSNSLSGWDSLNNLIFITTLEEIFSIQFTTSEIMSMTSIRSIHAMISKKIKE